MIKLAKQGLHKVLQPGLLNDKELETAFVTVEGLLNARPLSQLSTDPKDSRPLTPAHFALRDAYRDIAPLPVKFKEKDRYWFIQDLVHKMWNRFMVEVLPQYHKYSRNIKNKDDLKPDDLVVVLEHNDREKTWPVAELN